MAPRQQNLSSFLAGPSHSINKKRPAPSVGVVPELLRPKRQQNDCAGPSRFGQCPLCHTRFPIHVLLSHAGVCDGTIRSEKIDGNRLGRVVESEDTQVETPCSLVETGIRREHRCTTTDSESNKLSFQNPTESLATPWWKNTPRLSKNEKFYPHTSEPLSGLYLFENFITEEEEKRILEELDGLSSDHRHEFLPWKLSNFNGPHIGKRWGVHCNLRDRRVNAPENPLPNFFRNILSDKLRLIKPMQGCFLNEGNAIDYRRKSGHYLQSHVDDRQLSKEPIANVSVAGDCVMTYRNRKNGTTDVARVLLKRRTLQVLTGKARYDYSHGISNQDLLSDRRVSVTMRESPLTKI